MIGTVHIGKTQPDAHVACLGRDGDEFVAVRIEAGFETISFHFDTMAQVEQLALDILGAYHDEQARLAALAQPTPTLVAVG